MIPEKLEKARDDRAYLDADDLEFYAHNWNATMPNEVMNDGVKKFGERARLALAKIESVIGEK